MKKSHRRKFLQASSALAGATLAAPAIARNRRSANDRIRVGLLGLGGRMRSHVTSLSQMENDNVEIHRWGTPREFDFTPVEHFEIAGVKPGMDFETAAKLSGTDRLAPGSLPPTGGLEIVLACCTLFQVMVNGSHQPPRNHAQLTCAPASVTAAANWR